MHPFLKSFTILPMANMGTLHDRLHGGLWHTTHPERFQEIVKFGYLSVNPNIPNLERWKASRPEHYPLVRFLGGVSLFDFARFDTEKYEQSHPLSNWYEFVPHLKSWGGAVWINIDRDAISESFISTDQLVAQWDQDGHRARAIMPRIEAAHIGDLPTSAFCSAFMTWAGGREVRELDVLNFNPDSFDKILEEWRAASV